MPPVSRADLIGGRPRDKSHPRRLASVVERRAAKRSDGVDVVNTDSPHEPVRPVLAAPGKAGGEAPESKACGFRWYSSGRRADGLARWLRRLSGRGTAAKDFGNPAGPGGHNPPSD